MYVYRVMVGGRDLCDVRAYTYRLSEGPLPGINFFADDGLGGRGPLVCALTFLEGQTVDVEMHDSNGSQLVPLINKWSRIMSTESCPHCGRNFVVEAKCDHSADSRNGIQLTLWSRS